MTPRWPETVKTTKMPAACKLRQASLCVHFIFFCSHPNVIGHTQAANITIRK